MAGYLVNKNHNDLAVVAIKDLDGYKFRPRNRGNYVNVSQVTIVNGIMIDRILTLKFDKAFKRLVAMAMQVINDDDATSDDAQIVLDEAELVKEILINRYNKYFKLEKEQLLLKKLHVIENEIRMKMVAIKQKAQYLEKQEQQRRGRSL